MGFFHVINIEVECPHCKNKTIREVQFKYGINWMYTYNIGDEIIWGEDNFFSGCKTNKRVLVYGISDGCPICKKDEEYIDYVVEVEHNRIQKVYVDQVDSLEYNGYIVIDN